MQHTVVPTNVWQRRTNKIIAAGITIIGLTMMLSLIPQCIYIGVVFVTCALIWLGYMTMREKNAEVPRPEADHPASPVLFLVASHNLRQVTRGPSQADPEDKPPTYDQIIKLDGLPPDYYSVLTEKPPRYEDLSPKGERSTRTALPYTSGLPAVHCGAHSSANVPTDEVSLLTISSFLHEPPTSWSLGSQQSPGSSAAQNPTFISDSACLHIVPEEEEEEEEDCVLQRQGSTTHSRDQRETRDGTDKVPPDYSSTI